jgi:hypothetical protein
VNEAVCCQDGICNSAAINTSDASRFNADLARAHDAAHCMPGCPGAGCQTTIAKCQNGVCGLACSGVGCPPGGDAGTDAAQDAGACNADQVQVIPCCGGEEPPPDAAPCVPAPPFCAAKPTNCTPGSTCSAGGCFGLYSSDARTLSCQCA